MSNIIILENAVKTIKGKTILNDISLEIGTGKIIGLVGNNGSGKSTLLKVLSKMYKLSSGNLIHYFGLKNNIGLLIERPRLYSALTGRQNIKMFSAFDDEGYIKYLVSTLGIENALDTKVKQYSLGMKQKLGIVLALINKPIFVILDEPMNALDVKTRQAVNKLILELNSSGMTFLISSHIIEDLVEIADEILVLDSGKIIDVIEKPQENTTSRESILRKLSVSGEQND